MTMTTTSPSPKTAKVPIKVVLVEDHQMFREWLAHLITKKAAATVCGEADNIKEALEIIKKTNPDIALVDISLKGSSGLELIKDLKAHGLNVPVLVLSMHEETLYAERVLRAGARGYITKTEASNTLLKAIQMVLAGQIYLGEGITASILERVTSRAGQTTSGIALLADRELEVFQLIGKGFNGREIAERLHLGETTVDSYRARIKDKLKLRNAAELYSRAAQWVQEHGA
jgi:DNA-binding NarL/FixJ family response regulator